jgi:acylphosphatase
MSAQDRIARRVVVHGLVQGVAFRYSARRVALDAGVDGWVSNEYDGTVHALFEGPPNAVDRLVAWMHEGPSHAIVEQVDVTEADAEGLRGFQVR